MGQIDFGWVYCIAGWAFLAGVLFGVWGTRPAARQLRERGNGTD